MKTRAETIKSNHRPVLVWALIILQALLGIGALASGGLLMLGPDGSLMHMPLSLIQKSPFSNFFIPGLVLFTFLGIYPAGIAYGIWKKPAWKWPDAINPFKQYHWSWAGSLAVAAIVVTWLSVELIWVQWSILHGIYYVWSGLIILITILPVVRLYLKK
jgi:hypothetical protein